VEDKSEGFWEGATSLCREGTSGPGALLLTVGDTRAAQAAKPHPAPAAMFGLTGRAAEVQRVALAVVGITASRTQFVVSLGGERCYEGSPLSDMTDTAAHSNDTVLVVP
jgi:hypothetical protein